MDKIRLSKSVVGQREKEALAAVIDNGYLGMGTFVAQFEDSLRAYLKRSHVVCVNSGTAALQLSLMGLGLEPDSEVLVQSLTFVATFQAITAARLAPVLCEVRPADCTIDLADAAKRITPKTRAIMPVHYAGRPGDLGAIYRFAEFHGLRVVEDAAHSFGCCHNGRKIGSFGDVACFSFDGIKNITSGEGGAIATDDDAVAQFAMDARLLGVKKDTEKRFQGQRSWEFDVTNQGYRFHMSDLFAAIGLVQMERLEGEFKPIRSSLARRYQTALLGLPGLALFPDDFDAIVPHIYPVRVLGGRRDLLRERLLSQNIECGIHYHPGHRLSYFREYARGEFPVTDSIYSELLTLPLHPDLALADQDRVISVVKKTQWKET